MTLSAIPDCGGAAVPDRLYRCHGRTQPEALAFFRWNITAKTLSLFPALINTVLMTLLLLIVAVPIGIFSAIYLVEYARRGNRLVKVVRVTAETLSGIPSIVYGLFGFLFSGVLWLGLFHAGRSADHGHYDSAPHHAHHGGSAHERPRFLPGGSFGLGAGKLRTVFQIILPSAMPGILSGVIPGNRPYRLGRRRP